MRENNSAPTPTPPPAPARRLSVFAPRDSGDGAGGNMGGSAGGSAGGSGISAATMRALVRLALPRSQFPNGGEVGVKLAGRAEIAEWNARFRGRTGATDVLSFSYENGGGRIVGDIAVCPEVVRENALADGGDFAAMMAHAVAHGALHLAGRRHDTAEDARQMAGDEARILGALGFSRPGGGARV